jgi:RNA polymerase sigma factor (sigma-70 family)
VRLTQEAFDGLLDFLGSRGEPAAEKYEEVRRRLLKVFTCRGCVPAEELVDECIDRVAAKASKLKEFYQGDPALYFHGVARRVAFEYFKRKRPNPATAPRPEPIEDREAELQCLERCMEMLPSAQRELIIEYYRDEKGAKIDRRKRIAERMGIGLGALRIRAHRIRTHLAECVQACLEKNGDALATQGA